MKTILLIIAIKIILFASTENNNLKWVDTQIEAIKPERKGLLDKDIKNVSNPFAAALPSKKVVTKEGKVVVVKPITKIAPLKLQSIINNHVMINGKWYTVDDMVRDYRIAKVRKNSILLENKKHELKLFIIQSSADSKIKITKE